MPASYSIFSLGSAFSPQIEHARADLELCHQQGGHDEAFFILFAHAGCERVLLVGHLELLCMQRRCWAVEEMKRMMTVYSLDRSLDFVIDMSSPVNRKRGKEVNTSAETRRFYDPTTYTAT